MVEILDLQLNLVAMLDKATNVTYDEELNKPSSTKLTFTLPYNDPKLEYCEPFKFVRVRDKDRFYGVFRIIPRETTHTDTGTVTITCEPAIATLIDDVLFGYHQIGNTGVYSSDVIKYVLQKQSVVYWKLGVCEFTHQFEYSWEYETLLGAMFSVATPFVDAYKWEYDFDTTPWTVNLRKIDLTQDPQSYFRYQKNISSVTKKEDSTELCTVLYPLGYGEGENQLTIAEVNGGSDYLEATQANLQKYGRKTKVLVDRRFENAETLKEYAQKQIDALQTPRLEYTLDAVDLFPITKNVLDQPRVGDITRVIDPEIGVDITRPLVKLHIGDMFGPKRSTQIQVSNPTQSIAGTIADLNNRQMIEQTYSQGATNIYAESFNDNADPTHPAKMRFYIDSDVVRVNNIIAIIDAAPFRAYSKSSQAYGGFSLTSGSSPQQTSLTNSQQTSSNSPSQTTYSGGGDYASSDTTTPSTTSSGASSISTSGGGLSDLQLVSFRSNETGLTYTDGKREYHAHYIPFEDTNNIIRQHKHNMDHYHTTYGAAHYHMFNVPAHSHQMPTHDHTIAGHYHNLPTHTHQVPFPIHSHAIEYGIYEGTTATAVTLKINNKLVPYTLGTEINLAPHMKNAQGKIQPGTHYTLEITPNVMTRLEATLTARVFIQSHSNR